MVLLIIYTSFRLLELHRTTCLCSSCVRPAYRVVSRTWLNELCGRQMMARWNPRRVRFPTRGGSIFSDENCVRTSLYIPKVQYFEPPMISFVELRGVTARPTHSRVFQPVFPYTYLTGWVGFAWGTENSLRKSQGPSDTLESQFFAFHQRTEFPLVLMTTRS